MLCDNCKKNKATTYFKKTINGETTEVFLCEECAKKHGITGGSIFKAMEGFGDFGNFEFFVPEILKTNRLTEEKRCECGSTFRSIVKTGRVGCEKCYETFKKELAPTLRKMHGVLRHKPRSGEKANDPVSETESLRKLMEKAIKEENFEEAARLRDEIKAREGESK